jgi:hypothetical protein
MRALGARRLAGALPKGLLLLALVMRLAAPAFARPHPAPTPSPTPTPVADPAVTQIARQQFVAWQAGAVDKSLYAERLQPKLTDEQIGVVSRALGRLGALMETVYLGPLLSVGAPPGTRGYIYQMRCAEGNVYEFLILDDRHKIASLFFKNRLDTETVKVPVSPAP